MWIQTSPTHVFSCDASRIESISVRPIMHSENFGLFFKGKDEMPLDCGDMEGAREILAIVCQALKKGEGYLDLSDKLP